MKTLLAVDGSTYTEKTVTYLIAHPELLAGSSSVTALTVLPEIPVRARGAIGKEAIDDYYEKDAEKILAPVIARLQPHYPHLASAWKTGAPAKAIAETAQADGFELIVMGSHGHNALANLVMGSVATKVLARCAVPVLLIR